MGNIEHSDYIFAAALHQEIRRSRTLIRRGHGLRSRRVQLVEQPPGQRDLVRGSMRRHGLLRIVDVEPLFQVRHGANQGTDFLLALD